LFKTKKGKMKKMMFRMQTAILLVCGFVMFNACCSEGDKKSDVSTDDSSLFVTLTDAVPDAILEIRYFGTYNFVGTRIDGYLEPTALLTSLAADSLRASRDTASRMAHGNRDKETQEPVGQRTGRTL
jgi:D-alanyl-D-alanine dipeptidase